MISIVPRPQDVRRPSCPVAAVIRWIERRPYWGESFRANRKHISRILPFWVSIGPGSLSGSVLARPSSHETLAIGAPGSSRGRFAALARSRAPSDTDSMFDTAKKLHDGTDVRDCHSPRTEGTTSAEIPMMPRFCDVKLSI